GVGRSNGNDATCSTGSEKPTAPIDLLPRNAAAVSDALTVSAPTETTETAPALSGAIDYATDYVAHAVGRIEAVVLFTDRLPSTCPNALQELETIARDARAGMHDVVVDHVCTHAFTEPYVVGLGRPSALDLIALAGSGGVTHELAATGEIASQITNFLSTVSDPNGCDYAMRMPAHPVFTLHP